MRSRRADLADIFHEVDEEVRREQLKKLWEHYGNYFVALAVAVILGIAAYRGYEWWQAKKAAEAGAAFEAAMSLAEGGKRQEAEAAFARLAAEGTTGYRKLARLREAAELASHDAKAAIAAYDAIAADSSIGKQLQELAALRAAFMLVDTAPLDEMRRRLEPLTGPKGAFRHSARELLALAGWRAGDAQMARRWADLIVTDPETPASVRTTVPSRTARARTRF